jgi:ABC-type phosphate/phosphonate transport system substrate-binding protein
MTFRFFVAACAVSLCVACNGSASGQDQTEKPDRVRLGGVAYAPSVVTIFSNLTKYLNNKGFASDFVLYSDHEELVAALGKGDIDIAWMSPVTHGKYHIRHGWNSQTLAMRDVDRDLRVMVITRQDSGIKSPGDLVGKRLIVGRSGSQDGSLFPLYYFREAGVDVGKITMVDLKCEKNEKGKRADSAEHIMKALSEGRGDAAVVLEQDWKKAADFHKANPTIKSVWMSPEFCHCTFTAPSSFDKQLGSQFTKLMTSMDRRDPIVAELLRLENAGEFLPSD